MRFSKEQILEELNSKTDKSSGCWLWLGPTTKGNYGQHKNYRVNRLSAWIFLSLDLNDVDIQANHKRECPNKNCWNPDHLYVGNQSENMFDTSAIGNHWESKKTHCYKGHEYTPENTFIEKRGGWGKPERFSRKCKTCRKLRNRVNG